MRKFAAFDIDGTLIRWQLYHAISDGLVKHGFVKAPNFESIRGARMDWKRRSPGASFKSYEKEVIKAYEQALSVIALDDLIRVVDEVFDEYKDQVYVYTRDLVAALKAENYLLFAISGSQSEIVERVAAYYGFDAFVGTDYIFEGQKYSGQKVFHAYAKDVSLKKLVRDFKSTFSGSLAVGDSLGDIKMLQLVEQPIAFNPEKELYEQAKKLGWKVVVERKNVVYELEKSHESYLLA